MRIDTYLRRYGIFKLLEKTKAKAKYDEEYPNLLLLNYCQIESPKDCDLTKQCRGLIVDMDDNWKIISYAYDRFFNVGEVHAADIDWDTAKVYEKLDGSLITMYAYDGKWRVATRGNPGAAGPVYGSEGKTFADLFWQAFEASGYKLPPADNQLCFMFELMTPENRVVVHHTEYKVVLHGARNLVSLQELGPEEIATKLGWDCVKTYNASNLDEIKRLSEGLRGHETEGFVVRDANCNRVKIKLDSYVHLHHLRSTLSPKNMLGLVMTNEGSEFLSYFPEYKSDYELLADKFQSLCREVDSVYQEHKGIENQKAFAMAIKDHPLSAAMFSTRAGKVSSPEEWIRAQEPKKMLEVIQKVYGMEIRDYA